MIRQRPLALTCELYFGTTIINHWPLFTSSKEPHPTAICNLPNYQSFWVCPSHFPCYHRSSLKQLVTMYATLQLGTWAFHDYFQLCVDDLKNFRACCKQMKGASTAVFFSCLVVDVVSRGYRTTIEMLQALASAHPAATHVRHLKILSLSDQCTVYERSMPILIWSLVRVVRLVSHLPRRRCSSEHCKLHCLLPWLV